MHTALFKHRYPNARIKKVFNTLAFFLIIFLIGILYSNSYFINTLNNNNNKKNKLKKNIYINSKNW